MANVLETIKTRSSIRAYSNEKRAYYNEKLGIPEGYSYKVALAVGVPATTKEPHEYNFDKNVTIL